MKGTTELAPVPGMSNDDLARHQRARKAYAEARKLTREVRSVARMMARNQELEIEWSSTQSATDGKKIFIKVPMELGDDIPHQNSKCGERGQDYILTCPRCAVIEDVHITIIHEVAHIVQGTFEKIDPREKSQLVKRAIEMECNGKTDGSRALKLKERIDTAPDLYKQDYLNLSSLVSPFLPLLINACEDIRVNALMQQERPGTKVMFRGQTNRVFDKGVYGADGNYFKWTDCPPNAQALIGVYCMTWGLDLKGKILDEIAADLNDEAVIELVSKMQQCRSVHEIYRVSFPLLEALRRLGYMKAPEDIEDEPEPEKEQDEPEQSDSDESGERSDETQTGDSESTSDSGPDSSDERDSETSSDNDSRREDSERASEEESGESSDDTDSSQEPSRSDAGSEDDSESSDESSEGMEDDESDSSSDRPSGSNPESSPDQEGGNDNETPLSDGDSDDEGDGAESEDTGSESEGSGSDADGEDAGDSLGDGSGSPGEGTETGPDSTLGPPDSGENGESGPSSADGTPGPGMPGKDSGESASASIPEGYTQEQMEADGLPDEIQRLFDIFGRHEDKTDQSYVERQEKAKEEQAIELAMGQIDVFDRPSRNIAGVGIHKYDPKHPEAAWDKDSYYADMYGGSSSKEITVPEKILVPSLMQMRRVFTDNSRGKSERNLRSGKVNTRALAKRLPIGDDRVFKKNRLPGKKDYFVVVGIDCSGSTGSSIYGSGGNRLDLIKTASYAKAELLSRLGIPFAMYAHSGDEQRVEIMVIKDGKEPWGRKQKEALNKLQPYAANLDGHTMEFYRKAAEVRSETDRLILYYTDGAMPAENFTEEKMILEYEIDKCRKLDINLVAIGVQSTAPLQYGLDTILLNEIADVPKVVDGLRKRLSA